VEFQGIAAIQVLVEIAALAGIVAIVAIQVIVV